MAQREGTGRPHGVDRDDPRRTQLAVGLGVLGLLIALVPGFYIVWRLVPGVFGEWLGVIAGVISTPFLMEFSFAALGLLIVVGLNHWRQKKDGDEFVILEQVNDPRAPRNLPEHSTYAIYQSPPLPGEKPGLRDQAEGALAIRDYEEAARVFAAMDETELRDPAVLALRLDLARATGKSDLVRQLERELTP
jgi:hypothetical protein